MTPTPTLRVDPELPDAAAIAQAAAVLRRGGLVAFPTETVYGLGADARSSEAVARIFAAKERPLGDPIIVHVSSADDLPALVSAVSPATRELAARFWPGALTLILPKHPDVPPVVTAGMGAIGVRVPSHPVARALLRAAALPIAAPSANRFSRPSPTRAAHVLADLDGRIDLVLDGGVTAIGVESTVVDLTGDTPILRRPGGVSLEALREIVPGIVAVERYATNAAGEVAPGQLLRHYAPRATLTLFEGSPAAVVRQVGDEARRHAGAGRRIGILAPEDDLLALAPAIAALAVRGRIVTAAYGARHDLTRAAHELFDALRTLDAEPLDEILATSVGDRDVGRAIRDRLVRAAEGRVTRVDG